MADDIRRQLLKYADILDDLITKKVVQTRNSPVGDYAEWLVKEAFGLERPPPGRPGYDLRKPNYDLPGHDARYQVKARWLRDNSNIQLGIIRNLLADEPKFDFLIAVYFDEKFKVDEAYKIPHGLIVFYSNAPEEKKDSKYQNEQISNETPEEPSVLIKENLYQKGHIINGKAMRFLKNHKDTCDITEKLRKEQGL